MPGLRKTEDYYSIKTRLINVQNTDGTFPTPNSVLTTKDELGHTAWSQDLSLNAVSLVGPSGEIVLTTDGSQLLVDGSPVVNSLNSLTGTLQLVGGAGISVQSGVPAAQDIMIENTGVLSLGGLTGVVGIAVVEPALNLSYFGNEIVFKAPTFVAQYYLTSPQTLTNGSTDIIFQASPSWSDTEYITWTGPSADFTVAKGGLYQLEFNITIAANTATWGTISNKTASIDITRSPTAEVAVIATSGLMASAVDYTQSISATFPLDTGDVINCRVVNEFAGGPPTAKAATGFVLNTFFTWKFIPILL